MAGKKTNIVAKILSYGCRDIMLETSCRPEIKPSTISAIPILKETALANKVVSLSANQIGLEQRIFVCLKQQYLQPGKWKEYQDLNSPEKYEAIINPIEKSSSFDEICAFEECPSFEGLKFKVWSPLFINFEFSREQALSTKQEEKLTGFRCRVWDHEVRHLEGLLPIHENCCDTKFYLLQEYKGSVDNIVEFEELRQLELRFREKELMKMQKEVKSGKYKSKVSKEELREFKEVSMETSFMQESNTKNGRALELKKGKKKTGK